MIFLVLLALAPAVVIGLYIYLRDKYEREPLRPLLKSFLAGCMITPLAILLGLGLNSIGAGLSDLGKLLYDAFFVAALNEESLKFTAFIILIWKDVNFNEKFDGIVYAVFISLGFASIENIMYVMNGGYGTGIIRAFTAVPGHALDGVIMGFLLSKAKFTTEKRNLYLFLALAIPVVIHGIWDMLVFLLSDATVVGWSVSLVLWMFVAFFFMLWRLGMIKIQEMVDASPFKDRH